MSDGDCVEHMRRITDYARALDVRAVVIVVVGIAVLLALWGRSCFQSPVMEASADTSLNGCPLDSVEYERPTFGVRCYRVTDRLSGRSWWLVRMYSPSEWVVMPIGDSEWVPEATHISTSR